MLAILIADLVDSDDIGMLQVGRCFRLDTKTLNIVGAGELASEDHLYRDKSVQSNLSSFIDDSHSAARNFCEQFEVAEIAERPCRIISRRARRGFENNRWIK